MRTQTQTLTAFDASNPFARARSALDGNSALLAALIGCGASHTFRLCASNDRADAANPHARGIAEVILHVCAEDAVADPLIARMKKRLLLDGPLGAQHELLTAYFARR